VPQDFGALARPIIEAHLDPGESLKGIAAAAQQKFLSGQMVGIGVTDRRLLIQAIDRHMQAKGEPLVVTADDVDSIDFDGAGDGWWTAPSAILDANALTLRLRLRDRQKLKLMMMKGGAGLMGSMGGGTSQEQGVLALADWVRARRPQR
jgi:hypothetical protein